MSKVGIIESLEKNSIIRRIKDDDLYVSCNTIGDRVQSVRNKTHIQWCQVILLLRTLNEELLEDPKVQNQQYFDELVRLLRCFKQRFSQVLHVGNQIEVIDTQANITSKSVVISLALLEEIEMICSLLQQVFEHAELWRARDEQMFYEMKD